MRPSAVALEAAKVRRTRDDVRLMAVDRRTGATRHGRMAELASMLEPNDALVLNDAATWPASLAGRIGAEPVELRLAGRRGDEWRAVLFGDGDWRTPTEDRPRPPAVRSGDTIVLAGGIEAHVLRVERERLVTVRLDASTNDILANGRPIQYAYADGWRRLDDVQTAYAARPYAFEMPSAGWAITPAVLAACRRRGIAVLTLTHEAGISSTGDDALDAMLPFPERYEIPRETIDGIRGRRVIAVGTSVVRALEGSMARHGRLVVGEQETDLLVSARHELAVVDGLLTGLHVPGESHYELLRAFLPEPLATMAVQTARASGYLAHELGDGMLAV